MHKKLLAVAVGAALAAGPLVSAQAAEVKIAGKIQAEIVNVDGDTINGGDSIIQQGDRNGMSRWNLKASEDLGNGLTAIVLMDFITNQIVGGDGDENNREHYVGLTGSFGMVTLGRIQSAYKTVNVGWDPFLATFMQSRRAGGASGTTFGHNGFRDDIIQYRTPKGSPVTVTGQIVVDENADQDGEYHLSAKWKGGPLELVAAVSSDPNKDPAVNGGDDLQNLKVAARFSSGGFTGFFQYEDVDQGGPISANSNSITSLGEGSFMVVGLGYKFGSNMIHGNFGGFDADDASSDVDYFALGVVHFLSKKTRVYAGYSNIDVKDVGETDMFGAGIRFDFG